MTNRVLPQRMGRRAFLQAAAAASAVPTVGADLAQQPVARQELIDVNVYLSRWPFRRYPYDEAPALVSSLRQHGVVQAWRGRSMPCCTKTWLGPTAAWPKTAAVTPPDGWCPWGCINPLLPDWPEELRRCVEVHRMPGIRLHPNYHGYGLEHPEFGRLLGLADYIKPHLLGLVMAVCIIVCRAQADRWLAGR